MELSIFLAKFLGIYLLLIAIIWVWRKGPMMSAIEDIFACRGCFALTGLLSLMFGTALAVSHSIWLPDWRGLITLLGYLAIFKGFVRLGFPEECRKFSSKMLEGTGYWIAWAFSLVIGLYLTYVGFTVA